MTAIFFIETRRLSDITSFYKNIIGMKSWSIEEDIEILSYDNLLIGFQKSDKISKDFMISFIYQTKEEIDEIFNKLRSIAIGNPIINKKLKSYNFYAIDPEGRDIEFSYFMEGIPSSK